MLEWEAISEIKLAYLLTLYIENASTYTMLTERDRGRLRDQNASKRMQYQQ